MDLSPAPDAAAKRRTQLRLALAAEEQRLQEALHGLGDAVSRRTDVRARVTAAPYMWIGGCFFVGLWMGARR